MKLLSGFLPLQRLADGTHAQHGRGVVVEAKLRRSNFAKRVLGPAADLAGVDDAVTLHSLRHSFASICLTNGVPPKQVQAWMGHHSLTLTADLYGHLFASETNRTHSLLDAAVTGADQSAGSEGRQSAA
ncbi:tyrosine-type recombinase/integrase [Rhodococcus sp. NPDC049939]|uniref:tyrosine-type recombinase/integrase n=1 Tax=Rhodococcus sp. NPDC049939 TaxID=3155511 RepID=UPI00340207F7